MSLRDRTMFQSPHITYSRPDLSQPSKISLSHSKKPLLAAERMPLALKVMMRMDMSSDSVLHNTMLTMQPYQREFLELALARNALRFGEFTLKSGRKSPYFFNAGLFDSGAALDALGRAYAHAAIASGIA